MGISKEQKKARIMMHVNLIIGALAFILFVLTITSKEWFSAITMALIIGLEYHSFKYWKKRT